MKLRSCQKPIGPGPRCGSTNHKTSLLVRSIIFLSRTKPAAFRDPSVSQRCWALRRCVEDDASCSSDLELAFLVVNDRF